MTSHKDTFNSLNYSSNTRSATLPEKHSFRLPGKSFSCGNYLDGIESTDQGVSIICFYASRVKMANRLCLPHLLCSFLFLKTKPPPAFTFAPQSEIKLRSHLTKPCAWLRRRRNFDRVRKHLSIESPSIQHLRTRLFCQAIAIHLMA